MKLRVVGWNVVKVESVIELKALLHNRQLVITPMSALM
jgi:hypothetical protein